MKNKMTNIIRAETLLPTSLSRLAAASENDSRSGPVTAFSTSDSSNRFVSCMSKLRIQLPFESHVLTDKG